ncbi:DeoR/GlpR family DNA-binding transcription regulator [Streptococcus sp. DD13]|uniref:DeoR/GlpR family DNA-binding transcription regulator n=1 Tax=Streptococcus sp. DD13 TaxID=1777881 RepID=UPI000799E93A|nr:DeoR/GlpR family DNA-binding transcription regulator [Streptococcus sp. DD13]KXT77953.1 Lactose phosphotransferase system repressor [Streptococcus sp. DD13]
MIKHERLDAITRMVHQSGTVKVSEIMEALGVSDMTVRRDLTELENQGILTRVHGGAKSNRVVSFRELSHEESHQQNMEAKRQIAKRAAALIDEGDTIFLGPGTTIELLADEIKHEKLQVVTNCWPIFNQLYRRKTDQFKVFLLGGEMRANTQAFTGEMSQRIMDQLYFSKMFFSCSGVKDGLVLTSSIEEAHTQQLALERSKERFLLADSSKLGKTSFTQICPLSQVSLVLTDQEYSRHIQKELGPYTSYVD